MRTIDLDEHQWQCSDGTIAFFVTKDGTMKWANKAVRSADYRSALSVADAVVSLMTDHPDGEVVMLEDGSDNYLLASMEDAIMIHKEEPHCGSATLNVGTLEVIIYQLIGIMNEGIEGSLNRYHGGTPTDTANTTKFRRSKQLLLDMKRIMYS
jgi:hypothetical protein